MAKRAVDLERRIVAAAADLLASGGREAVSSRAVCAAAGVQAPAIYRQFGDMAGLLQAAAREVLARHVRAKRRRKPASDPLEELRRGWDIHVGFGLANPAAYALIHGQAGAGETLDDSSEVRDGFAMLQALVGRLAEAGRLRMSVARAARLIHAGACGVTLSLIASAPEDRDLELSHVMRDIVFGAIVGPNSEAESGRSGVAERAVALGALLPDAGEVLSSGERQLLVEWLDRLSKRA